MDYEILDVEGVRDRMITRGQILEIGSQANAQWAPSSPPLADHGKADAAFM